MLTHLKRALNYIVTLDSQFKTMIMLQKQKRCSCRISTYGLIVPAHKYGPRYLFGNPLSRQSFFRLTQQQQQDSQTAQ